MTTLRIACLQHLSRPGDVAGNVAELDIAASEAVDAGADLLITAELFVTGYDIDNMATLADVPLVDEISQVASRHRIGVLAGVPERLECGGLGNNAVMIARDGRVLGRHTKSHLWGRGDSAFTAGRSAVTIVEFEGVRLAMLICYDLEFPENARAAALAGAHLIAVPTANMEPFEAINEHMVWARAWENQVYVAYVNHAGKERRTIYVGRSSVVSPTGEVLAKAGRGRQLIVADLDTSIVMDAQRTNTYLRDRRPDLYGSLIQEP